MVLLNNHTLSYSSPVRLSPNPIISPSSEARLLLIGVGAEELQLVKTFTVNICLRVRLWYIRLKASIFSWLLSRIWEGMFSVLVLMNSNPSGIRQRNKWKKSSQKRRGQENQGKMKKQKQRRNKKKRKEKKMIRKQYMKLKRENLFKWSSGHALGITTFPTEHCVGF